MLRTIVLAAAAALALPGVAQAKAAPLLDCPLRDAPYSIDSPFVDLLLNPAAKQVLRDVTGKDPGDGPAMFVGTKPPTFAAILTIKEALAIGGGDLTKLPEIDAKLRAIPVTRADKVARCQRYDNVVPKIALPKGKGPRLLLFEKINGFRDVPSVTAAHAALMDMAKRQGWRVVATEQAGEFNARTLAQFDAVIWNNISGDVLTLSQRAAFQRFLQNGGGFVGLHGSAGDPVYFWDWYPDKLIGARFAGHPMNPQFQEARIAVNKSHPLAAHLPSEWRMTDEWYSFKTNPRAAGANVLLTLDESTYTRQGRFGEPLDMGADHPIAWTQCLGKGRMFYSAIGHLPATYTQDQNAVLLRDAIEWAASKGACR